MALAKVIYITFSMLLLRSDEGTALTIAHEVPSISVAVNICEPEAVFAVLTFSPLALTSLLSESNIGASPTSMGSVADVRFCPATSATLLNRTSLVSLLMWKGI